MQTPPRELDQRILVESAVEETHVFGFGVAFFEGAVDDLRGFGEGRAAFVGFGVHDVVPVEEEDRGVVG